MKSITLSPTLLAWANTSSMTSNRTLNPNHFFWTSKVFVEQEGSWKKWNIVQPCQGKACSVWKRCYTADTLVQSSVFKVHWLKPCHVCRMPHGNTAARSTGPKWQTSALSTPQNTNPRASKSVFIVCNFKLLPEGPQSNSYFGWKLMKNCQLEDAETKCV